MPVAEAVRLIDLVNYQEGAVVSRALVSRATGTVTLFAFDEGQGLSEHTAPFDAVAHLLEGEAEIAVSGKPLRTKRSEERRVGKECWSLGARYHFIDSIRMI